MADLESPVTRRDRRKLELQSRIIEAAEGLFEERGYDQTKVSEICERADIAYGTFFNHFPEKQDVLRALADRSVQTVTERLEELAKQPGSIEELLISLFEGSAEAYDELGPMRRDLIGRIQAISFAEAPEESDRRFHGAFEAFLAEAAARDLVRSDVPIETLADILAGTFSSLSLSAVHFEDFPIRERSAAAARFLARSVAPRQGG
ncbi:MAG: hypothetical protein CL910_06940 [Deltaproteobacteria bacterium]|nr:hypothetical protein [Deltaproteobacteria bacterium]